MVRLAHRNLARRIASSDPNQKACPRATQCGQLRAKTFFTLDGRKEMCPYVTLIAFSIFDRQSRDERRIACDHLAEIFRSPAQKSNGAKARLRQLDVGARFIERRGDARCEPQGAMRIERRPGRAAQSVRDALSNRLLFYA